MAWFYGLVVVVHKCPVEIPKGRWRDLWAACLVELGDASKAEARLLERMILNLMAADVALRVAMAEPEVMGSKEQLVENSQFRVAARCDGQALQIARQLKLTTLAKKVSEQSNGDSSDDPFAALDAQAEGRKST